MLQTVPRTGHEPAVQITAKILADLFRPAQTQNFAVRLWNGQVIPPGAGSEAHFTLVLTHPGALRRMLAPPGEVPLGEAYMRGDFDIEGDIVAAMTLAASWQAFTPADWLRLAGQALTLPLTAPPQPYTVGWQPARLRGQPHSRRRDRDAVAYHYNAGNEFYELFLSPWMMYSGAYFPTGPADLAAAQVAQLELICRKLRLRPGERLLDIGCGWGGLLVYAAAKYGIDATGITLSSAQADYARAWIEREGLNARARVEICDYRDLSAAQPFDKIASIEMFGHVGRDHAPDYFGSAFRVLKPNGLFLLQDFVPRRQRRFNRLQRALMPYLNFSQRYFLPDVELTPLGEIFEVAEETGFEVREVEGVHEHYPATMRHWINRLEAQHDRVVQLTNERAYRLWRLYLAVSVYGLSNGQARVYQTLLSKKSPLTT